MAKDGYKIRNKEGTYFITFAVVEWVDVFTRKEYRDLVLESLKYCQESKGLIVYAWCIMSNHLHLILGSKENNLSDILRDFKKFTSKALLEAISSNEKESRKEWMLEIFRSQGAKNSRNKTYQFWRQENHPVELYSEEFTKQKLNYLHMNPVVAGIVDREEAYLYSSCKDYYEGKKVGLLQIEWL